MEPRELIKPILRVLSPKGHRLLLQSERIRLLRGAIPAVDVREVEVSGIYRRVLICILVGAKVVTAPSSFRVTRRFRRTAGVLCRLGTGLSGFRLRALAKRVSPERYQSIILAGAGSATGALGCWCGVPAGAGRFVGAAAICRPGFDPSEFRRPAFSRC